MKLIILFTFAMAVAVPGFAQAAHPRLPNHPDPVDCFAVHAGASCKTFNDMLQAGKFTTMLAQPASRTFVCFRQQQSDFVVVHYDLPDIWESPVEQPEDRPVRKGQPVDTVESSTSMTLTEYKDGVRAMSLHAELLWSKAQSDADRDAIAGTRGTPAVNVSPKQVSVVLSHMNNAGTERVTDYSLKITRATRRFDEQLPVAKTEASISHPEIKEAGFCTEYSQAAMR